MVNIIIAQKHKNTLQQKYTENDQLFNMDVKSNQSECFQLK